MTVELMLQCPSCGSAALAGDEFCEACGTAIGTHDEPRHHLEVDLATVAAVTDRGLVHRRNDDAFHVEVVADGVVVVVCDGVFASTAPDVAAQVAATAAGEPGTLSASGRAAARRPICPGMRPPS